MTGDINNPFIKVLIGRVYCFMSTSEFRFGRNRFCKSPKKITLFACVESFVRSGRSDNTTDFNRSALFNVHARVKTTPPAARTESGPDSSCIFRRSEQREAPRGSGRLLVGPSSPSDRTAARPGPARLPPAHRRVISRCPTDARPGARLPLVQWSRHVRRRRRSRSVQRRTENATAAVAVGATPTGPQPCVLTDAAASGN